MKAALRKSIFASVILGVLVQSPAWAALPRSAINNLSIKLYGMYTTSDPTCQTGLVATLPLSSTPTTQNLAASPTLGSGALASTINCVILVMQSGVTMGWASGTYTGTTNGNPDSGCNTTGSIAQNVCRGVTSLAFPATLVADAASRGITLASTCGASGNATDVIAAYISTASQCAGNITTDPTACVSGGNSTNNSWAAPTSSGAASDNLHGIKLGSVPSSSSALTFAIDPDQVVGGAGGSTCGAASAPKFSFHP